MESVETFEDEPPPYTDADAKENIKSALSKHEVGSRHKGWSALASKDAALVSSRNSGPSKCSSLVSSNVMRKILKHTVDQAMGHLVDSGVVEELMSQAIDHVTTFESTAAGEFTSEGCNMKQGQAFQSPPPYTPKADHEGDDDPSHARKTSRSRVAHRVSSYGSTFGCVWVRNSTLHLEEPAKSSNVNFRTITSFMFYPPSWLRRFGVKHGVEASMVKGDNGWQFQFNPVRAVPESSPVFDLCRYGQVTAVELLISKGHASILDTSPKGWTPLHVRHPIPP